MQGYHFASILGAKDDHFLALEGDGDRGLGAHRLGVLVSRKLTGIDDGKVRRAKGP